MYKLLFPLLALFVIYLPAQAQQPQPQQKLINGLDPLKPIDAVLLNWENAMSKVDSLVVQCTRTTVDKTFQKKTTYKGYAKFLKTKTGSMYALYLQHTKRPELYEKVICTGEILYLYAPSEKLVYVYNLKRLKGNNQANDDNLMSLLLGMKAAQAKQRYQLTYVPPRADDKYYYYVDIQPRAKSDKADFTRARMVLIRYNFLPRQLWFEEPNGNEITWDLPAIDTKSKLTTLDFQQPRLEPGWNWRVQPVNSQPRIMRNQK